MENIYSGIKNRSSLYRVPIKKFCTLADSIIKMYPEEMSGMKDELVRNMEEISTITSTERCNKKIAERNELVKESKSLLHCLKLLIKNKGDQQSADIIKEIKKRFKSLNSADNYTADLLKITEMPEPADTKAAIIFDSLREEAHKLKKLNDETTAEGSKIISIGDIKQPKMRAYSIIINSYFHASIKGAETGDKRYEEFCAGVKFIIMKAKQSINSKSEINEEK